jgi:hypothetical protein
MGWVGLIRGILAMSKTFYSELQRFRLERKSIVKFCAVKMQTVWNRVRIQSLISVNKKVYLHICQVVE